MWLVRRFDLARMSRAPRGRRRLSTGSLAPAASSSSPLAPAGEPAPQARLLRQLCPARLLPRCAVLPPRMPPHAHLLRAARATVLLRFLPVPKTACGAGRRALWEAADSMGVYHCQEVTCAQVLLARTRLRRGAQRGWVRSILYIPPERSSGERASLGQARPPSQPSLSPPQ